ncbi:MAG TPA: efflux RND transporter permease subunit [Pirellulaceae bacterium]|nr:efflux RND transporter permease subunit [Pirellulaceae bacterium]HMO92216.1 efflux RND transporter permease subunit [Pirellulaceae bacterium]HMP68857.1 efflux RND transporter permease subunit [Pirellulaceae bacterium]
MIQSIVKFCIRERLVVMLVAILVVVAGWFATTSVPLDAIPNVGDNQVIVLADWPGQSPKDVEDQLTYPLSVTLQSVPGAKSVRGRSMFGFSFVQVTFDDSVDFYWARARVVEQLLSLPAGKIPKGVTPVLSPDATALGQILYYALEGPEGTDLADLRSLQDYVIKLALESVDGVAEVASIGGYVRQYQVEVDPDLLRYHNVQLRELMDAVQAANVEVGAKTVETSGMEYLVRGKGFLGSGKTIDETIEQLENTVVVTRDGIPIRVADLASVQTGPADRQGALDLNGSETVGGIVVMRYRQNPRDVIKRVQEKIASLEPELRGVSIRTVYDRMELIEETVETLSQALFEETLITIAVVTLFLLHFRSSMIVAVALPLAVLMSFIAMKIFDVDANIMSLAGIAIAIGTMIDMAIIILENIYDHLAEWEKDRPPHKQLDSVAERQRIEIITHAAGEVAPAVVTAVSTTLVSFLPVFFLTGRDAKLFTPLAWTKSYAIVASLIVAITLVPAFSRLLLRNGRGTKISATMSAFGVAVLAGLSCYFMWGHHTLDWLDNISRRFEWGWEIGTARDAEHTGPSWALLGTTLLAIFVGAGFGWALKRERIRPIDENPVSRFVRWLYAARLRAAIRRKMLMLSFPLVIVFIGFGAWIGFPRLLEPIERLARVCGAELNDVPGYVSAKHLFVGLVSDDWIALDEGSWFYMPSLYPAASFSQSMEVLQTQGAMLREIPEVADVLGKIGRAESALDPAPVTMIETYVMLKPRAEWRKGITPKMIWDEVNAVATLPGVTLASPLQPIEGRVVMLASGIKASMAIRVYGDSLSGLAVASTRVAEQLRQNPLVDERTVNPDIVLGKPYFEFEVDREESARSGMSTMMVNEIVSAGLGGVEITNTVEGRERYPVQVRFRREIREDIDQLSRIAVVTPSGNVVPLGRLASIQTSWGPGMISSEDSRLVAHVMFSPSGMRGDIETVEGVMESLLRARVSGELEFPAGNFEMVPVGSFENQVKSNQRLAWLGPLLNLDYPKQLKTLGDWFAWLLHWTPLGLVPLAILINYFLLYLSFRNVSIALTVFTGIPVAFAGGMIAVAIAGIEVNTAIWIGFIALFGIAVDDGVVMATYIQQLLKRNRPASIAELRNTVYTAGMKRVRPCLMTTVTTLVALVPVLISDGRGADVARAMAIPVFGGMLVEPFSSFVVPTIYCWIAELKMKLGISLFDEDRDPIICEENE